MQRSQTLRLVAVLAAATMALAGCSSDDDGGDDGGSASTPTADDGGGDDGDGGGGDDGGDEPSGEPITLRFSAVVPETSPIGQANQHWMDEVTAATNGQVEFESFFAGSLVGFSEHLPAMQDGRIDVGFGTQAAQPDDFPLWMLSGVPFAAVNAEAASRALQDLYDDEGGAFKAEFDANGVVPMFFDLTPSNALLDTDAVITDLSQMEGKRYRVLGYQASAFELLGGVPEFLDTAEVYEGLQRGIIDGVTINMPAIPGLSWHEPAPYLTQTGLGIGGIVNVQMNKDVWEGLPDDVRSAIEEVNDGMYDWYADFLMGVEAEMCQQLRDADVEMGILPEDQQQDWMEQAEAVYETWLDDAVRRGVSEADAAQFRDDYLALVDEYAGTVGYEDGLTVCAGG